MGHDTTGHSAGAHGPGAHTHHGPPPPPEPKTPMWLPAVGAVLFLAVALAWGLSGSDASSGTTSGAAPAGSAAAAH